MRGLRGNPALADWLQNAGEVPPGARLLASADSGIVRVDDRRARNSDPPPWAEALERALGDYGLRSEPRRPRAARRAIKRAPDIDAPAHSGRSIEPRKAAAPPAETQKARRTDFSTRHHHSSLKALLTEMHADLEGLGVAEAARRLLEHGPNEIRDITARSDIEILTDQFNSVPVALLAGSGALALATRAFGDAAAIGTVLAANGAIGYVTERRAEQTVSALRKLAPRSATVLRDGAEVSVPAREIVVGDVLVLSPGDQIPADGRVIESHRLSANEAPLTGESLPVRKESIDSLPLATPLGERRNMLHMGTVISGGTGRALVVATAERTALGSIRALAQTAEAPHTRMQEELDGLGKRLAIGASGLCIGLFAVGLLRGRPALPLLRTAVSLGVAAIPEGLPTVATSLLAAGIRTLQKRNVYARRLDAIENLGAVDVVGFDKTGTLTQNRMSVASAVLGTCRFDFSENRDDQLELPDEWMRVCALCNDVEEANGGGWQGSSTEIALIEMAAAHGADVPALRARHPRLEIKQRSEHHPYMVTLHAATRTTGGESIVAMKGRPTEVLERCRTWFDGRRVVALTAPQRKRLLKENDALAALGQRVLALAIKRQKGRRLGTTGEMIWLGLVGLSDPLRPGIAKSIARFRAAGIRTVMLTGDQLGTAQAVAREIGLNGEQHVADAGALPEDSRQLVDAVEHSTGFARSSPAMKLQIIRALQSKGHVVAMTGDGVNDGPALKTADVGVAMGASGTDFAQAMSHLVLQDDHPDGLLAAIAEGRTSYLNVKKAVRYLVSTNVSELGLMGLAVVAGLPDPLDPLALLWTNLITDVSPAIALGLEPPEPDVLERPPFPRTSSLLTARDWKTVATDGGMMTAAAMAAFLYGLARYGPTPRARTIAFMTLTSSQLLYALSARSEAPLKLFGRGRLRRNPWLTGTVIVSLGAQAATVLFPPLRSLLRTAPIGVVDAAVIAACAASPTLARETLKRLRWRAAKPASQDPQA
ncbi:MAG TPA: cation-transporting P-type ATPase [Burkholderiaceae bacterium]|nr:cation-transporting P-type ATPase [Burkholderiaceae bacterium]